MGKVCVCVFFFSHSDLREHRPSRYSRSSALCYSRLPQRMARAQLLSLCHQMGVTVRPDAQTANLDVQFRQNAPRALLGRVYFIKHSHSLMLVPPLAKKKNQYFDNYQRISN